MEKRMQCEDRSLRKDIGILTPWHRNGIFEYRELTVRFLERVEPYGNRWRHPDGGQSSFVPGHDLEIELGRVYSGRHTPLGSINQAIHDLVEGFLDLRTEHHLHHHVQFSCDIDPEIRLVRIVE